MDISRLINHCDDVCESQSSPDSVVENTIHSTNPASVERIVLPPMTTSPPDLSPKNPLGERMLLEQRTNYIYRRQQLMASGATELELGSLDARWEDTLKRNQSVVDRMPDLQAEQARLHYRRVSAFSWKEVVKRIDELNHQLHPPHDEGYSSSTRGMSRSTTGSPGQRELPRLAAMKLEESPTQQLRPPQHHDQIGLWRIPTLDEAVRRRFSSSSSGSDAIDVDIKAVFPPILPRNPLEGYQEKLHLLAQQSQSRLHGTRRERHASPRHQERVPSHHSARRHRGHWTVSPPTHSAPTYRVQKPHHYTAPAPASSSPPKAKEPHSNKKYNYEQIDFMRYHHDDLHLEWRQVSDLYSARWPDDPRASIQCLTSRYYRDNWLPLVDSQGRVLRDERGGLRLKEFKVRDRNTPEGKGSCMPYTLVECYPWLAVGYEWVREEDRERARGLVREMEGWERGGRGRGEDLKTMWRVVLRETERELRPVQGYGSVR